MRCLSGQFYFSEENVAESLNHIFSSSPRHLREAIRMSPLPELSESGLHLSWRWAKLPQSHRSETAIPSLPRDSLSVIEGIRTGQRARKWPGQWDILYLLTHYSSTLPPSLSVSLDFKISELFLPWPSERRGEWCNLSPLPHPSSPTASQPLTHPQNKQTHSAPSPLCCDMELMDYFSNWFQKCT